MHDYLYPKFLEDAHEYVAAERLWQSRWSDLLRYTPEGHSWKSPWLATAFADGTPMRDGNPIFSAVSPNERLGVRVIQLEPASNDRGFSFWVDKFAKDQPEELSELVITYVMTDENLLKALDLIRQWIRFGEIRLKGDAGFEELRPEGSARFPAALELACA